MKPPGFILKKDAAMFLGVKVRTIDNMMRRHQIAYYKFGHSVVFKESDLIEAVERCKVKAGLQTAYDSNMDPLKQWTHVCQWLRAIKNGKHDKHAMLAKDCLAHIAKFVE